MMTSKESKEAFVWIWLPGKTKPVVAGKLAEDNGFIHFNYGKSYLERIHDTEPALSIYGPELPLRAGLLPHSRQPKNLSSQYIDNYRVIFKC